MKWNSRQTVSREWGRLGGFENLHRIKPQQCAGCDSFGGRGAG